MGLIYVDHNNDCSRQCVLLCVLPIPCKRVLSMVKFTISYIDQLKYVHSICCHVPIPNIESSGDVLLSVGITGITQNWKTSALKASCIVEALQLNMSHHRMCSFSGGIR